MTWERTFAELNPDCFERTYAVCWATLNGVKSILLLRRCGEEKMKWSLKTLWKRKSYIKRTNSLVYWREPWIGNQRDRGLRPAFPLINCVTLGHTLQFCGPQFHQQKTSGFEQSGCCKTVSLLLMSKIYTSWEFLCPWIPGDWKPELRFVPSALFQVSSKFAHCTESWVSTHTHRERQMATDKLANLLKDSSLATPAV